MRTNVIKAMDQATAVMMRYFSAVVPDVSDNDFVDRVAYGFNVGPDLLARCLLCEVAYLLPVILLGYICLEATGGGPMSSMRRRASAWRRRPDEFTGSQPGPCPAGPSAGAFPPPQVDLRRVDDRADRRPVRLEPPGHAGHEGGQGAAGRSAGPVPRQARPEPDGVGPDRSHQRNDPPGDVGHAGRRRHDALVEGDRSTR